MNKRILVITPFFYPHVGGSQQYMEDLYATLVKQHPEVFVDVLCYNTDNAGTKEQYKGLTIYRIPAWSVLPGQFALANPLALIKFLSTNRNRYDLVHTSTRFFDSSWWAPFYAKLIKKKIVLTDHCAERPVHNNAVITFIAGQIDKWFVGMFLPLYDAVFATNNATKKFLEKTYGLHPELVYGGVDTIFFKPIKGKKKKLQATYIGRMIYSKGVEELFSVAKSLPQIQFVFAGPGPLVAKLQLQIVNEKIGNITLLGPINKKEVVQLLSESTVFVHPSFHHEGFPNALVEAGACQTAVIATDVGGSQEIIMQNKTGMLIKPHDTSAMKKAIVLLVNNTNERERLAQNLYVHVQKNFSWEKISEEFYQKLQTYL